MPDKELAAYLDGVRVGTVRQTVQGNTTFVYDDDYRRQADATPLSLSMPLTQERHPSRVVVPFLQGLLPDSEARLARLATEFRTSTNPFALLTHVGRDAAGAVQLLLPGADADDAAVRNGEVERLSDNEFAARVRDLVEYPESWGVRSGADDRWSLPGAQPKLALFRFEDGSWGVPRDSTPTTHILKPAVPPFADHDINEHVTMSAGSRLGLEVAEHAVLTTTLGDTVFVSKRYDRTEYEGRWRRLHQEDLCQVLGVSPARKYQTDGGPGVAQIAGVLREAITDLPERRRARQQFFGALVFNVFAAGTDAHAKNYSLLLAGRTVRFAPLYDLGTHAPYASSAPLTSAMRIGDNYRLSAIGMGDFLAVARRLSLEGDWAEARVNEISRGIAAAFHDAASETRSPFARTVADAVAALAEMRGRSAATASGSPAGVALGPP